MADVSAPEELVSLFVEEPSQVKGGHIVQLEEGLISLVMQELPESGAGSTGICILEVPAPIRALFNNGSTGAR